MKRFINAKGYWGATTVLLVPIWMAVSSQATAFGAYREQAVTQFKLEDKSTTCAYCHVEVTGGAPWNPFGQLVQANLESDIAKALFAALEANLDSDGDGYTDRLEVYAKTLPGDEKSKPTQDVKALEAALG